MSEKLFCGNYNGGIMPNQGLGTMTKCVMKLKLFSWYFKNTAFHGISNIQLFGCVSHAYICSVVCCWNHTLQFYSILPCWSVCLQGQLPNSSSQCAGARGPQPNLYITSTKNTDYTGLLCNVIYGSGEAMVSNCKIVELINEYLANVDPFT